MTSRLFFKAIVRYLSGVILLGLLLFLPAGTLWFRRGWLFMGILFIPMFLAGIVLMLKNPVLLEKRLNMKETQSEQSLVIKLSGLMFVVGFILAGLDFRFSWCQTPGWVSWLAAVVFLLGYGIYAEVLRENTYLSRTVEVQKGQKVIDTGLYGIVRHPMYSATLLVFLPMPLILGSWIAFIVFLFYPLIIVKRIRNEEQVLTRELNGYAEYTRRVRYRLIPHIW